MYIVATGHRNRSNSVSVANDLIIHHALTLIIIIVTFIGLNIFTAYMITTIRLIALHDSLHLYSRSVKIFLTKKHALPPKLELHEVTECLKDCNEFFPLSTRSKNLRLTQQVEYHFTHTYAAIISQPSAFSYNAILGIGYWLMYRLKSLNGQTTSPYELNRWTYYLDDVICYFF